jgi:hypothetical protein
MLNRAFNDVSPSYNTYTNQVAVANSSGVSHFALLFGEGYRGMTEAHLSTLLLRNMGLLPNAGLQTALTDYLVFVGKANVGIVALQLGQILSGLEGATGDLAIYGAAAARWNLEVAASHAYSSDPANQSLSYPPGWSEGTGVTLSLSNGDDVLEGTIYGDVFLAPTPGMLGSSDVVDGAGSSQGMMNSDALKAVLGGGESVVPLLKGVENVFFTAGDASHFSADRSTGIQQLWREAAAGSATFTGVHLATKVGIQNSLAGGALNIGFAGASGAFDSANIVLADATGADAITVSAIETLTIDSKAGTVAATTVNQARISADAAQVIAIGGGQGLTTTVTGAHIGTIDASGLSGALNLGFATTGTGSVGVNGGTAGDTLTIDDVSGARLIISSGDGGDTVTIGAGNAHIVTLGSGADTLHIGRLAGAAARDLDTSTAQALGWSAILVTDFENGVDAIRLTGASATTKAAPSTAQLDGIAASASLLEATALAATTAGANKAIAFRYGADTYILVSDAVASLGANDSLVKLSGVAALADASWAVA